MFLDKLIQWLENNSQSCFYKKHFGFECLGCGLQRSVIALLKGDISESFEHFPALMPLLLMFIVLPVHLKFRFIHGAFLLKTLFLLSVTLIIGNFIFRNLLN